MAKSINEVDANASGDDSQPDVVAELPVEDVTPIEVLHPVAPGSGYDQNSGAFRN